MDILSSNEVREVEAVVADVVRKISTEVEQQPNPFAYKAKFTAWELFKCVLGIVVVPVRLVLMLFCVLGMDVFAWLSLLGHDNTQPMSGFRRAVQRPCVWFSRLFLFVCGFYWINIKGKMASTTEAMILVGAPHSTAMDPFVLVYACNASSAVAKYEVSKMPLLGIMSPAYQSILVRRELKDAKAQVLNEIKARAAVNHPDPEREVDDGKKKRPWRHIVIFPEGES